MTGSSLPMTSEDVAMPSSDFRLSVVNISEISTMTLDVSATPVIISLIPEQAEAVAMVSRPPAVSVAGLEPLGAGDLSELFVQGRGGGSMAASIGFGSVSAVRQLSQVSYPDFPLPWEDDLSVSPSSKVQEGSISGVVVSVDLPGLEETLAKAACGSSQAKSTRNSSPAKSLIRRGFFGSRDAPPTVLDDTLPGLTSPAPPALPGVKGATSLPDGAAALGRSLSQPVASTSAVSKSQLWYFRRVKDKVAKQLIKNKETLAETVVVNTGEEVEGYSKEVHSLMDVAFLVGMTWGGDDNKLLDLLSAREQKAKGMRELKNLDCSISPVKSQRRRGGVGFKNAYSFPP